MALSKKELEKIINGAIDSIIDQLRTRDEARPACIIICETAPRDILEKFQHTLSTRFPLNGYNPAVIIGQANEADYSIDVSYYLRQLPSQ